MLNICGSYPAPQPIYLLWVINRKIYRSKKAAFSDGSESAAVISAGFIICFFGLGIEVEKCYQIYLVNFKSSVIAKQIGAYPLLLSKWWRWKFGLRQKKINFWTKTDRIFSSTTSNTSWWVDQIICHLFFGTKIPSWDIPVWEFQGVDNFSSKVHTETKNRPIPIVKHVWDL